MKSRSFTRLKFSKTKHLLCKGRINGKTATLLLDTGASNSCIHTGLQNHFDLKIKGDPFDAAGAGEGKMKAVMTSKCALRLGRTFASQQAFVLLDLSHVNATLETQGAKAIDGIIGADFLKKHKALIDYAQYKLYL